MATVTPANLSEDGKASTQYIVGEFRTAGH